MTRIEELQARVIVLDQDSLNTLRELTALYESEIARKDAALNLVRDGLHNLPRSATAEQLDRICESALTPETGETK